MLCKAVLMLSLFDALFFMLNLSRGLHYISLYALILQSTFALLLCNIKWLNEQIVIE